MRSKNAMLWVIFLMMLSGGLMAVSIPLTNPGFEGDDVPPNSIIESAPSGWIPFNAYGSYYPIDGTGLAGNGISGPQSGDQYLIMATPWGAGHVTVRQEIPWLDWADLKAGETLTVKAWTTYRNDLGIGNVYMWLNDSDGTGLYSGFDITDGGTTAAGVWAERTWEYTITQDNINAGWGPVEFQVGFLCAGGHNQVAFDDISLEYSGELPGVRPVWPEEYRGGNRVETDVVLTWVEKVAGGMTNPVFDVYMDPNETKVTALDPAVLVSSKQSEFSFDPNPDLDPNAIYFWRIATYLDSADTEPNSVTEVSSFRTVYEDEHWTGAAWTSDADIQVSAGKIYTHKVNINAGEAATTYVNGVSFENDSDRAGVNWLMEGAPNGASGTAHNVLGDGARLIESLFYIGPTTLTLTDLIPGQEYIFTEYVIGWGANSRPANISTSADGHVTELDQAIVGAGNGYLFKYAYTAPSSGELTLTYESLLEDQWHHYAFSNEVYMPVYVDPTPLPGANISSEVELSWVLHGDVVNPTYNLKVSADSNMTNLVLNEIGLSTMLYTLYLNSDTQYYWQVEVADDGAVVYTSPVWSFVTAPPPDATMVMEWKFDEIIGTIAEQTGPMEDADGILIGFDDPNTPGVSHVAGLVNNALLLNGKDEYVDVSNAQPYMPTADGQSFAISGYFRSFYPYGPLFSMRNSTDGNPLIDICLGNDGDQELPGQVCLLVRDDAGSISWTSSGIAVNDGRWHNFIVTRVNGIWTLYIDGISHGVINGAATGNVNLDLLSIGSSLRWIMDNHNPENSHIRNVKGMLDEYTVWDGQLQPHQIAELASIVPPQGDIDFDLDTDVDDLTDFTTDWLASTWTPVQDPNVTVLEDMEIYTSDPNSFKDYWTHTPSESFAIMSFAGVPDPDKSSNQVMQIDYDFNGKLHGNVWVTLLNPGANMSLYDQVDVRIKKLPGCDVSRIILDFYDGRDIVDPTQEDLYNKGRIVIDTDQTPVDEWVTVSGLIPADHINLQSCTDLHRILFSIQDGGEDVGTLLIDTIALSDSSEDCIPVVGQMVPDMNGDCAVDMLDFAELAQGWLLGIQ